MNKILNNEAEFCGRVPLNQTNLIQPHGVLLVVDKNDLRILQASENATTLFESDIKSIVAARLPDYFSSAEAEKLLRLLAMPVVSKLPFILRLATGNYLAIIHQQPQFYIIEIEKERLVSDNDQSFISVYNGLKNMMAAIEAAATTEATCRVVVDELKKLSGFDKVMIYQFDEDWNGDVIAEAKEEGMDSYLGLKFPASDIPKQARELYKKTPYRLIPTTEYEPVRLYPVLNPQTNAFTDLSDSNLRSVAGVHLEYLRNMKVTASMSTRILKDGVLWGLIACHHKSPNYLSYEMRSVFELLSSVITAKISVVQSRDLLAYITAKQALLTEIAQCLFLHNDPSFYKHKLLSLLEADGLAIILDRHITTTGNVPLEPLLEDIAVWLQSQNITTVYHQTSLAAVYEAAEQYAEQCSGLLALPIDASTGNFILAFRAEAEQKVAWGGNPSEAVQFESDGKKYHPRASFKKWLHTVKHTSLPWNDQLLKVAESLSGYFIAYKANNKVR